MAKRVIQHAHSGARRTHRVKKPNTPWKRSLTTDVPEEVKEANPDCVFRWAYGGGKDGTRARIPTHLSDGWFEPKLPKDAHRGPSTDGGMWRKDCKLLALTKERKEARDYFYQERAEQHLTDAQKEQADKAAAAGFSVVDDQVDLNGKGLKGYGKK